MTLIRTLLAWMIGWTVVMSLFALAFTNGAKADNLFRAISNGSYVMGVTSTSRQLTNVLAENIPAVRLVCTQHCIVAIGASPQGAMSAGGTNDGLINIYLPANEPAIFRLNRGSTQQIAVVSLGTDGLLYVTELDQ